MLTFFLLLKEGQEKTFLYYFACVCVSVIVNTYVERFELFFSLPFFNHRHSSDRLLKLTSPEFN